MITAAWILLAALVLAPVILLLGRTRKSQTCACGQFKLPRAEKCFDCTNAELAEILPPPEKPAPFGVGDLVEVVLPEHDTCHDMNGMVGFIVRIDDAGGYQVVPRGGGLRAEEHELRLLHKADQAR
jgi:hypothetical protein